MTIHKLDPRIVAEVQEELDAFAAKCRIAVKRSPRGRWEIVRRAVPTLGEALQDLDAHSEHVVELAVFLDHDSYGGIMVWTSRHPAVVNRFDGYAG